MTKIAIFPGTFDPVTLGHQDIIHRAAQIFEFLIVGVAQGTHKQPLFSLEQRVELMKKSLSDLKNVQVIGFSNLLVEFAQERHASVIVRGVRLSTEYESEIQLAYMNRALNPGLETVFLTPNEKYSFISSSVIKDIAIHGGPIETFVNKDVAQALQSVTWR